MKTGTICRVIGVFYSDMGVICSNYIELSTKWLLLYKREGAGGEEGVLKRFCRQVDVDGWFAVGGAVFVFSVVFVCYL